MKTIILTLAFALGAIAASGQKSNAIPEPVKHAMKKLYPSAQDIEWKEENGNYEAEFKGGGKKQSVLLDDKGSVLETEIEVPMSDLPKAALQYLEAHYKGQKVKETAMITDAKGIVTYEAEIKEKDLLFDSNGNFLKEHVEKDQEDHD
jgi:hypothetical protein